MSGKRLLFAAFLLMPGVLSACAPRLLHNAPPVDLHERAEPAGFSQIRFWADDRPRDADALIEQRASLMKQRFADAIVAGKPVELSFLALSGGGADGAFGAGLLNGWTEHGTRPEFEVVTGVSTGALIAPFAFLGPEWDDELEEVYTTMTTESLLVPQILQGLIGGAALTNSLPFRRTIEKYATEEMLHSIAAEHRNGRRLFVGTTALDAARSPTTGGIQICAFSKASARLCVPFL